MEILLDIIKGSIMVIQKSLSKGHYAGFITGLGSCVVDTIFSIIAIFALAAAEQLINQHRELILLVGGLVVTILGWSMSTSDPFRKLKAREESRSSISVTDFLQAVAMGLSNPGAIFVIFALFAFFGIGPLDRTDWRVAPIILSVSLGAAFYWFVVTWLLSHFRKRFKLRTILWINRITGAVIIMIGLVLMGEGLFRVLFRGARLF